MENGLKMKKKQKEKKKQNKPKKIEPKEETEEPIKEYNFLKRKKKGIILKLKEWYKEKYHSDKTVLVNMELLNGMHQTFLVKEKNEGFKFKGNKYLFDDESKYLNVSAKTYSFDFHERISIPVKRSIPVSEIKATLEQSRISEVEYAINPSTLERFETSKIAEGIMKGQKIDEMMRKILVIMFIVMVTSIIHMLLFMQKSGMFEQIKGVVGG